MIHDLSTQKGRNEYAKSDAEKRMTKGADFKEKINAEWIEGQAQGHLEAWADRYSEYKNKKDARFDLNVNHDPSLEVERAEEDLGRKLNDLEQSDMIKRFNLKVIKLFRN